MIFKKLLLKARRIKIRFCFVLFSCYINKYLENSYKNYIRTFSRNKYCVLDIDKIGFFKMII